MQSLDEPQDRARRLAACADSRFDLVVIGGGIHGAAVARDAAIRGLSVLLLERADYASGTSSRSSKLLHGGVRYLEQGNLSLLYEALGERATMQALAPHLTRTIEFAFPVTAAAGRSSFTIGCGLRLYDLLARFRLPSRATAIGSSLIKERFRHGEGYRRYTSSDPLYAELSRLGLRFTGLHGYVDGQMEDTRLVIEHVVDVERLNGYAFNYVELTSAVRDGSSGETGWRATARDLISGQDFSVSARFLVNCAGPWTKAVSERIGVWKSEWPDLMLSRGSHLLFRKKWEHPGLILPAEAPGRVYFVLPYFSADGDATLVGTTDIELAKLEEKPQVSDAEQELLLALLKRDLPAAGLDESSLYAKFAGVRALPRKAGQRSSEVSRSEHFLEAERYLTFLGGKYTTARRTAERMVDKVERQLRGRDAVLRTRCSSARLLPGAAAIGEPSHSDTIIKSVREGLLRTTGENRSPDTDRVAGAGAEWLYSLFGARALEVLIHLDRDVPSPDRLLLAAARFAVRSEHAVFAEDIFERRLLRHLSPERKCNEFELIGTTAPGSSDSGRSVE